LQTKVFLKNNQENKITKQPSPRTRSSSAALSLAVRTLVRSCFCSAAVLKTGSFQEQNKNLKLFALVTLFSQLSNHASEDFEST
jgi:hypothetical protein